MTGRTGRLREASAGTETVPRFSSFFDRLALQRDSGPKALHQSILNAAEYRLGDELPTYLRRIDSYGTESLVAERLGPRVGFAGRVGATIAQVWYDITPDVTESSRLPPPELSEMSTAAGVERYRAGVARVSRNAGRFVRQLVAEQRSFFGYGERQIRCRMDAMSYLGSCASLDKTALASDPVLHIWAAAAELDTVRLDWAANHVWAAGSAMEEVRQRLGRTYLHLRGSEDLSDVSASTITPRLDTAEAWYEMGRLLRMSADLAYLGDAQGFRATALDRARLALRAFETAQTRLHDEIGAKTPAMSLRWMDGPIDPGPIEYLGYLVSRYDAARRDTAAVVAYLGSRST